MIDNPDRVERLLAKLTQSMPLPATATPGLVATIREQSPGFDGARPFHVTQAYYGGDEAGIVCRLDLGGASEDEVFFVSITHLMFARNVPQAREIAAYQKHRTKRLRRLATRAEHAPVIAMA